MKGTELSDFRKLSLLLALLLCSLFAFTLPASASTVPAPYTQIFHDASSADEAPFILIAGEVSAGETEGVLRQYEKTLLPPFAKAFLQLLYPQLLTSEAPPAHHPFLPWSNFRHSILTKGP